MQGGYPQHAQGHGPPPAGYPPQQYGGGYPPQQYGGGYPQQGGYPPQGGYGGYPQQGGYPPQPGHSYPPSAPPRPGVQQGFNAQAPPATNPSWYNPPAQKGDMKDQTDRFQVEWEAPLLCSCFYQPLWCLCGYFCAPCTAYFQRRKLLMADKDERNWQYYHCCAGIFGESCTARCDSCTQGNECCCAALEACCCLGCAVHANRYMIQLHYGLENTCCDIFLFWLNCICQIVACILQDDCFEAIADIFFYILMGCMMAQHENEMDKKGYPKAQGGYGQGRMQ